MLENFILLALSLPRFCFFSLFFFMLGTDFFCLQNIGGKRERGGVGGGSGAYVCSVYYGFPLLFYETNL